MDKRKVIIDCDPGMDDSIAIVVACKSDELDVKAITTVNGNYPIDVTTNNARKILELLNMTDIPVARGMSRPMIKEPPSDPFSHGDDGQAENFLPEPTMPLSEKHAVEMIIDTIKEYPNEIYVLCLGPMSNLAMAMVKAPEIVDMIAGVYAISGAFGLNEYAFLNATGDTPQSEWNVYVDPDAAKIVYESGVDLVALGLDVATNFDIDLTADDITKLEESNKPEAKFLLQAVRFVNGRGYGSYCAFIDCMAVAYAIDNSFVETMPVHVGVETQGKLTYGMTVVDRRNHHVWEELQLVNIGISVDYQKFLDLVMKYVLK